MIINGAFSLWLIFGHPLLPTYLAPRWHGHLALLMVLASQFTFYLVCTTDPGTITKDTIRNFDHYDYDGVLYTRGRSCRTCNVPKVARYAICKPVDEL